MGDSVIQKIIKLLLVLFFMILIFSFSKENGNQSTKRSDSIITYTVESIFHRKLTNHEKEFYIDKFVYVVRKSAHFLLYFLFGISVLSFIREFVLLTWKSVLFSAFFVFIYACSDEFHQLFISGRSGEIGDVFIDTVGGFLGLSCYFKICDIRRRKNG